MSNLSFHLNHARVVFIWLSWLGRFQDKEKNQRIKKSNLSFIFSFLLLSRQPTIFSFLFFSLFPDNSFSFFFLLKDWKIKIIWIKIKIIENLGWVMYFFHVLIWSFKISRRFTVCFFHFATSYTIFFKNKKNIHALLIYFLFVECFKKKGNWTS